MTTFARHVRAVPLPVDVMLRRQLNEALFAHLDQQVAEILGPLADGVRYAECDWLAEHIVPHFDASWRPSIHGLRFPTIKRSRRAK